MHNVRPPKRKTRVGIRALRSNLGAYIKRAHDGQIIEVTLRDQVVAELRPPFIPAAGARRKPGTLKGRIKIAADFSELPEDVIDAFES